VQRLVVTLHDQARQPGMLPGTCCEEHPPSTIRLTEAAPGGCSPPGCWYGSGAPGSEPCIITTSCHVCCQSTRHAQTTTGSATTTHPSPPPRSS
jgi:hypothetical protein